MASALGVIVAVSVSVAPGAMDATDSGAKVTVQPVGADALGVTAVTGAVPVFVTVIWKGFAVPAFAVVERTLSGVEAARLNVPVIVTVRSVVTVLPCLLYTSPSPRD